MSLIARLLGRLRSTDLIEERLTYRTSRPALMVEINGYAHKTRNWSAGGALLIAFAEAVVIGTILNGKLFWEGEERRLHFTAEVMRLEPDGSLALRWLDLPLSIQQEMEEAHDR